LNKKSDWKKFEFGVKPIFPQYAYVIGKKIIKQGIEPCISGFGEESKYHYSTSKFVL